MAEDKLTFPVQWRPIKGYEGYYEVSNTGLVKRMAGKRCVVERLLSQSVKRTGYCAVLLSKNAKKTYPSVHRLVAEAFISNPHNKSTVNHKNGNKADNSVNNLEWMTLYENLMHAEDLGLRNQKGEKHHNCILTAEQVLEIKSEVQSSHRIRTHKEIGKAYGVTRMTITAIAHNKIWGHLNTKEL